MIDVHAKDLFFDRAKVVRALDRARLRVLKESGRIVRKQAQRSLVYAAGSSVPGGPPHAHRSRTVTRVSKSTGKKRRRSVSLLRDRIWFAFDAASSGVVVGPAKLGGMVGDTALEALEHGGPSTVLDHGRPRRANIRARPFMRPAAAVVASEFPKLWRDSIR